MKLIGIALMILSTTSVGLLLSKRLRDRVVACDELIKFCDNVSIELGYTAKPIKSILSLSNIPYINQDMLVLRMTPKTVLRSDDNIRIGEFVFSLGKSDINSQLKCIDSFKAYITQSRDEYENQYKSKSKVYICLGICCGIAMALVFV